VADLSLEFFCVVSSSGYVRYASPEFERMLGCADGEMAGRRVRDFIHPADMARVVTAVRELRDSGQQRHAQQRHAQQCHAQNRWICRDGRERLLRWTARFDPGRRLFYAVLQDAAEYPGVGEQAALRRVATLVAEGPPPAQVFQAVAAEMRRLFQVESAILVRFDEDDMGTVMAHSVTRVAPLPPGSRVPIRATSATSEVRRTRRPARRDGIYDLSDRSGPLAEVARELGVTGAAKAPIVVQGQVWGWASIMWRHPAPAGTEARMVQFTELVGTAIANADSRAQLAEVAAEQAALRRVATLVAEGTSPAEVFEVVAKEMRELLDIDLAVLERFESDDTATIIAISDPLGLVTGQVGTRLSDDSNTIAETVRRTGRTTLIETYRGLSGPEATELREKGFAGSVGTPVVVEGRLWGAAGVMWRRPMPGNTESRLTQFMELIGTAIANADSRAQLSTSRASLATVAAEQAALRRVATLVAEGASPAEVFEVVAEEMRELLPIEGAVLQRFEADGTATVIAISDPAGIIAADDPVGRQVSTQDSSLVARVRQASGPVLDGGYDGSALIAPVLGGKGITGTVGVPVIVDGRPWGMAAVAWRHTVPGDTGSRLSQFTELLSAAIANADSREQLEASRARVVAAADHARQRIERNLHDGVQQHLIALILELRDLETVAPGPHGEVASIAGRLGTVLDELREIARGLHPPLLRTGGLGPALRTLARRSRIPVLLEVRVLERLPDWAEVAAYHVVAESLANAAKHAQARTIWVTAQVRAGTLQITVRDDGIGGADPDKGTGLIGLRDRVEALSGTLIMQSVPGAGTTVQAAIPLRSTPHRPVPPGR
jgi:PAS domain S-box-containing protein